MLGISSGLMYGGGPVETAETSATAFRSTWDTRIPSYVNDNPELAVESSAVDTIVLPLTGTTGHDFTVWWGDPAGSSTQVLTDRNVSTNPVSFTYDDAGVYEIAIEGVIGHKWQFGNGANDRQKIADVSNWGTFTTGAETGGFSKCSNMICTATDSLTIGGTTMAYWFNGTSIVTINTSNWFPVGNSTSSLDQIFGYCDNLVTVDASSWDTSAWVGIRFFFDHCFALTTLDTSGWDLSSVTNMSYFFRNCSNLDKLGSVGSGYTDGTTGWSFTAQNGSHDPGTGLINLAGVFQACVNLPATSLVLDNWDVSRVKFFSNLFIGCSKVTVLNTASWDTASAVKLDGMFMSCSKLEVAHVDYNAGSGYWNTQNVTTLSNMFNNCVELTTLPVGGWDVSKVESFSRFARNCDKLQSAAVHDWEFDEALSVSEMFYRCDVLTSLVPAEGSTNARDWRFPKATNFSYMFSECLLLETLDVQDWTVSAATTMAAMFMNCEKIAVLDVADWNVTNVLNMSSTFAQMDALTTAGIAGVGMWNNNGANSGNPSTTAKVTTMAGMFSHCTTLTTVPISNWNVEEVTSINSLFYGCTGLVDSAGGIDLTDWTTSKLQTAYRAFSGCSNLITIDVKTWDMAEVTDMRDMFASCSSCTTLDVQAWDVSSVKYTSYMFFGCFALTDLGTTSGTHIGVKNWNVSSLLDASGMFHMSSNNASSLSTSAIDVSLWNTSPSSTSSITDTAWMFYGVKNTSIDVSNWDVHNVIDMAGMFVYSNITGLDISGWNTSPSSTAQVKSMRAFVGNCTGLDNLDVSSLDTSGAHDLNNFFANTPCASSVYADIKHWDISSLKERGQANWEGSTVTNSGLYGLLSGTTNEMSTVEYDAVLVAWEGYNTSNMTVDFDAAQASSSGAGAVAHTALVNRNWTITDGDSQ